MKIIIAKTAGFCMGVRRAVEMVLDAPGKHGAPIWTYGPLIHNSQVLSLLEEKGIFALTDIPESGSGTVLIRAHGVPPSAKAKLKKAGFKVIDATCPRVIKVQTIIKKHARQGFSTIIVGDREHPEVVGLLGCAGEGGVVVDNLDDLKSLPSFENAIIVAQTTQNTFFFESVNEWAAREFPRYKVFNTICGSTERRQAEVLNLAESVESIVVVGGRDSGNTRRLAEVAARTGKPVYHIESESELDERAFSATRPVGITAGASTPNWIIKRVYRTLEALPFNKKRSLGRFVFTIQRALLLTNIYVAVGAGCLCYACAKLMHIDRFFSYVLISILYIHSMHMLNHLIGTKADRYNDPERADFNRKHRVSLAILAITGGGAGLLTAFTLGPLPFSILLVMSILGLSYNLRVLPKGDSRFRYTRIRDLPGSKTILIATAWGIVTAAIPSISASGKMGFGAVLVTVWSTCMVFVRTAFFDILEMQGDRIVGKETIPILIGEKAAIRMLMALLAFIFILLLVSGLFHLISPLGFPLLICPLFITAVLSAYRRGHLISGIRLEFLIETHFILAGAITLAWALV
jgi:4-hydroxy-3-methylbut-2-enyl diphosphate reductase